MFTYIRRAASKLKELWPRTSTENKKNAPWPGASFSVDVRGYWSFCRKHDLLLGFYFFYFFCILLKIYEKCIDLSQIQILLYSVECFHSSVVEQWTWKVLSSRGVGSNMCYTTFQCGRYSVFKKIKKKILQRHDD